MQSRNTETLKYRRESQAKTQLGLRIVFLFIMIFGKIGRIASEDVVYKSKCIPILLYAVEACPVNRSLEKPLQFSVTRILMKIFKTRSSEIVTECQTYFGFYTVSTLIRKRKATFLYKLANSQNELCELFEFIVREELNLLT